MILKLLKGILMMLLQKLIYQNMQVQQKNTKNMSAVAVGLAEIIGAIKDIGNSDIGKNMQIISDVMDKTPDAMKTIAKETKRI